MPDTVIRIIVDPSGAVRGTRVVNGALGTTTRSAQTTTSALNFLRRAVGLLGVAFGVREVLQYADTFTQLQNRIRVAGIETDRLNDATGRLLQISNRTRTDLESNVALFQRLGIAQDQLGASTEELFQFVETVGNALAVQGAAAGTARGAILQLSQAVGSSIVRGEEFNSILEGAFPVALAAAQGIDRAGGSVARLRTLVVEGQISSEEFFRAILSQSDNLAEQFGRTTATISQAITVFNNQLTAFIGGLDTANGFTGALAQGIITLSLNLDTVVGVIGVFIGALSPVIIGAIASAFVTATTAVIGFIVALGPIGIAASVIGAATAAIIIFGDEILPIEGSLANLQEFAVATFTVIAERANIVAVVLQDIFGDFLSRRVDDFVIRLGRVGTILQVLGEVARNFANLVINAFRVMLESAATLGAALIQIVTGDITGASETIRQGLLNGFNIASEDSVGTLTGFARDAIGTFVDEVRTEADRLAANRPDAAQADGVNTDFSGDPVPTGGSGSGVDRAGLLAEVNRELQLEGELLALNSDAREVETQLRAIENELKKEGVDLTAEERQAFEQTLQSLQALNEETMRREQILDGINGPQQEAIANLEVLNQLQREGAITAQQFAEATAEQRLVLLDESSNFADGVERGLIRAQESIGDFADEAERAIAGAFKGAEDALTELATTGQLDFRALADSIIADLIRISIRQGLLAPLSEAFQTGSTGSVGGGGGSTAGTLANIGISALASFGTGGVQNTPTVSRLAENGPEGIVPLDGGAIPVKLSGGGGRSTVINNSINVTTPDADSFRQSQDQILAQTAAASERANVRNN